MSRRVYVTRALDTAAGCLAAGYGSTYRQTPPLWSEVTRIVCAPSYTDTTRSGRPEPMIHPPSFGLKLRNPAGKGMTVHFESVAKQIREVVATQHAAK